MIGEEAERDISRTDEQGPTRGLSTRRRLLIVCLLIVLSSGCAAAWYFELGVSSEVKRQRFIKSAHESLSQGKIHEAITALTNASEADPTSADTFHNLGMAYPRAGNQRQAFRQFLHAVQLNPNLIPPRFQLARLQASKLALVQANKHLIKIREINPNAMEGILLAVEIALAERNFDGALGILRDASKRQPNETIFHMNSAAIYMAQGNYKAAEANYKLVLDRDPKSRLTRAALAAVFLAQGKQEQAEQELLTMTKDEPDNDELLRVLGNFYIRTWRLDRVEKVYRDLLVRKPGS